MKLYGSAFSSSAWRVRTALHLCQVPYEHVTVHLALGEHREGEHTSRNPMQQIPTLEWREPDGTLRRLSQSMAIVTYLDRRHPRAGLVPSDPFLAARAVQLAEMVNSYVQPMQGLGTVRRLDELGVDGAAWAREHIARGLGALERECQDPTVGAFLVGDAPTVADVFLVPQLQNARRYAVDLASYPRLLGVDARCADLPAFQAAHPTSQPDYVPD